jgi:hypothetical protein
LHPTQALYHPRRIIRVVVDSSALAVLRLSLDNTLAGAIDPSAVAEVRRRLATPDITDVATRTDDEGWTCWRLVPDGGRRRLLEVDRSGNVVTLLGWAPDGNFREAWVRLPDTGFVGIQAPGRAGSSGRDRLQLARAPGDAASSRVLGTFPALDYTALREIPVLPEPASLPAHAGTAVLNLLATLAADSGQERVRYRGPYPTEALFLALLESFHYGPDVENPLQAFADGHLHWQPAPHTRWFTPEGVYVQRRGRVEKVVWRTRAYYRPDWQGVARHAPRRVHDADDAVCCSLWALGRPLETHLRLDTGGAVHDVTPPAPRARVVRAFDGDVTRGIGSIVIAQSAPPLGASLEQVMSRLVLEWGPVDADLATLAGESARISTRLLESIASMMREAPTREMRLSIALAALAEIAALLGDGLRGRAQAMLLARPEPEQAHALTATTEPRSAHAIATAAQALVTHALTTPLE